MTLPACPRHWSGRVQDPRVRGGSVPCGSEASRAERPPRVCFKAFQQRGLCIAGRLPGGFTALVNAGIRTRASRAGFSKLRMPLLRNEKNHNHHPAPRAPHDRGARGARGGPMPGLCRERGAGQGRAAGVRRGRRWRRGPGRHARDRGKTVEASTETGYDSCYSRTGGTDRRGRHQVDDATTEGDGRAYPPRLHRARTRSMAVRTMARASAGSRPSARSRS